MEFQHLNRELVGKWVKHLLQIKGSNQQKELLKHNLKDDSNAFVEFIESSITATTSTGKSIYYGEKEPPSLLGSDGRCVVTLTAGHMYLMPPKEIIKLYQHWKDIPLREAADSNLWGAITLSEIRGGRIKPTWLAVDKRGSEEYACSELDRAIRDQDAIKTDRIVRRILRWMMGPGHMRGAPELYGNCSLAKAWWCGYLAHQCAEEHPHLSIEDASQALKNIWLELADYLSGKLTVISEKNVLNAVVLWANQILETTPEIPRKKVRQVILGLGEVSSWCVLGVKPTSQIYETIQRSFPSSE